MSRLATYHTIMLGALLGLCSYGGSTQAEVISIDFTATVTEAVEGFIFKKPLRDLKVGDTIAGRYFYDSAAPDSNADPDVGLYRQTTGTFGSAIHFSQRTLAIDPTVPHIGQMSFTTRLVNNSPGEGDFYDVEGRHMTSDRTGFVISWKLSDRTGKAISNTALPTVPPPLAAFPNDNELFVGTVGEFSTLVIRATVLSVRRTPPASTRPTCDHLEATIVGTPKDDILHGTDGDDVIVGLGGNDIIDGRGGHDIICGGEGNDVLLGGSGHDRLFGGVGDDLLDGDTGDDRLFGGPGRDWLLGGPGDDYLLGEEENDGLEGGEGRDELRGGAGDDILNGDDGDDLLSGEAGNDWLRGGPGMDSLFGDEGDDGLEGDDGVDTCNGGSHVVGDMADDTCETLFAIP